MTRSWLLLLASLLLGFVGSTLGEGRRPNVILIVTDDQGYGDMSCHGNPWLKTPNLDRLAAESVRLEDYHVDPVCTPTRAALMTGRYSTRVGAWTVTQGRQLLKASEVTMADLFEASGYRTAMFGKWHLGDTWPYAPRFRGFQTVVRHLAGGIDEIGNPIGNDYFDDTYYRNGEPEEINGYCTDVFFRECQEFIAQADDRPFFVYLPLNAMHGPHTVAEKYSAPFRAAGHGEVRSKFFGQIVNFDENLGRLMEFLHHRDLHENTIVVFMGDNGSAAGVGKSGTGANPLLGFNAGMRGKKGSVFEGGHRVACFVRWPARLKRRQLRNGGRIEELTSCRDWLPTFVDWCGLKSKGTQFDGRSLTALIEQPSSDWPERTLFVQRQGDQPTPDAASSPADRFPHFAVLTEQWRFVDGELFSIRNDRSQKTNVAVQFPQVVRELRGRYEEHFRDVFPDRSDYARFQVGSLDENPTLLTVRDWHPTVGRVIWKQSQLGDAAIEPNGFWAIHVARSGKYKIQLSRFPDDAKAPMRATKAKLKICGQSIEQTCDPEDNAATFHLQLTQGGGLLQTWIEDQDGVSRGAYFVKVEWLE